MKRASWVLVALALGGTGCGNGGGGSPTPDSGMTDLGSAPTIPTLTVSPSNGAKGVLIDTPIVLAFSEPMNRASVEAGWNSTSLPSGSMVFSWNAESTILQVDASAVLQYPVGGLAVDLLGFEVSLAGDVQDAEGDQLAAPFSSTFDTARDITYDLAAIAGGTGSGNGTDSVVPLRPGDTDTNATFRAFATFDISDLPVVVQVVGATFTANQQSVTGTPYADLGNLETHQIAPISTIDATAVSNVSRMQLSDLSTTADVGTPDGNRSVDFAAALTNSIAASESSLTLRLQFTTAHDTNSDDDYVVLVNPTATVHILAE